MARQPVKPVPIIEPVHEMLSEVAAAEGRSLKNMNEELIKRAHRKLKKRQSNTSVEE